MLILLALALAGATVLSSARGGVAVVPGRIYRLIFNANRALSDADLQQFRELYIKGLATKAVVQTLTQDGSRLIVTLSYLAPGTVSIGGMAFAGAWGDGEYTVQLSRVLLWFGSGPTGNAPPGVWKDAVTLKEI
jgi:hypothetical protein